MFCDDPIRIVEGGFRIRFSHGGTWLWFFLMCLIFLDHDSVG